MASQIQSTLPRLQHDRAAQSRGLIEYLWAQGYRLWWHITPLFNPQNFRTEADNRYSSLYAFNMLGVPQESGSILHGLEEIVDATAHPLAKRQT